VDAGAVCEAWRTRLFDYAWLHAAAGQYTDFRTLAVDALKFALSTRKLDLSPAQQEALVEAYSQLDPWPDTRSALAAWKLLGIALAPLANYSPVMLERLLAHSGLSDLFDAQISTASARTFKPHPNAYALGVSTLKLPREQIAFAAFGGWDAAGAKWFGFPTFWMNRLGVEQERLRPTADATGASLSELAAFVEGW
jgi:2-haloacid dehalogenase